MSKTVRFTRDYEVLIEPIAMLKQRYIVAQSSAEVAWLGEVERHGDTFIITDIHIPVQSVSSTTVNLTSEETMQAYTELMAQGIGLERLRYHGHSHVNMRVNPSAVDQDYLREVEESGVDWFVRAILNKKDELRVDLCLFAEGIVIEDIGCAVNEGLEESVANELSQQLKERVTVETIPLYSYGLNGRGKAGSHYLSEHRANQEMQPKKKRKDQKAPASAQEVAALRFAPDLWDDDEEYLAEHWPLVSDPQGD